MQHRHGSGGAECRAIFEQLSEYLDGELPEDACETIDEHMTDCPPCQAFLESMRRTVRLVRDADAPAVPEEIRRAVREAWERYREGGTG